VRLAALLLLVVIASASAARADDPAIVLDPAVRDFTALGNTIVWVSGSGDSLQLMRHDGSGDAPVPGALPPSPYFAIDLGRDARRARVLTYMTCVGASCRAWRDDLAGHHVAFKRLAPQGCALSTTPAVWGARLAYAIDCGDERSGLYVRRGTAPPRRLVLPKIVRQAGADFRAIDLRGATVATDASLHGFTEELVFSETVSGTHLMLGPVAAREGDVDSHVADVAVGPRGVVWSLIDTIVLGSPNNADIYRSAGECLKRESIMTPADQSFAADDVSVAGSMLYLDVPGTGIVTHAFAPESLCQFRPTRRR
jgi:hypothetical protein